MNSVKGGGLQSTKLKKKYRSNMQLDTNNGKDGNEYIDDFQ